ncbi:MAG: hypothetical protein H0V10_06350 [Geodermatophilaceae bacterium]|nr:hypothetical protein [Geodermatophilaceae bacterium]
MRVSFTVGWFALLTYLVRSAPGERDLDRYLDRDLDRYLDRDLGGCPDLCRV